MPPCNKTNDTVTNYEILEEKICNRQKKIVAENKDAAPYSDPDLKRLYLTTTFFCLAMVVWIMVTPASWLLHRSRMHQELLLAMEPISDLFFFLAPRSIVYKYATNEHTLVHATHLVPGAVWMAIVPFQLHPTWRQNHKKAHRLLGYLFLGSSWLIGAGVVIIVQRQLTFHHFFPDLELDWKYQFQKFAIGGMSIWFVGTALQAVRMARVRRFQLHQKWMVRHVASGIWIAVQRMVFTPLFIAYFKLTTEEMSQWQQREAFGATAQLAWISCIVLGEYAHQRAATRPKLD